MSGLGFDDFTLGAVYDVSGDGTKIALALDKAQALQDTGREGGAFRLEFLGPEEPVLPQATYRFAMADGAHDIFIVPIAQEPAGTRYEAIFYKPARQPLRS